MDAQQFLADFRYIADAPGGIAQLRRTIYQLAITGSLTPRAVGSDTSQALLEEIQSARQRLIGAKKYKRMIELESEGVNVPPSIVLPPSWCWTRLLDIGEINPRNDADDDTLAAFVPMSGVPQTHRAAVMADTIRWGDIKKRFTHFANGDVILGKITPCFENGKAAVIKALPVTSGIGAGTTELHVFRPIHRGIVPDFVHLFLRSPHFALDGERHMTGTAGQKRLPTDYFATRALPLPPFEEQVRIVAKVDELMALCDKLESQHLLRRKMQNVVRNAVLHGVSHSVDSRQLEKNWSRFTSHLELLFHSPNDISSVKGMILDLAVMGQFVASDVESQATGGDLIELIDTLRTAWYKSSQGQEQKEAKAMVSKLRTQPVSLPKATLPEQWRWSTLLRISQVIVDCDHKTPQYVTSGIHLIRTTDVRDGKMLLRNTKKVSEDGYLGRVHTVD